MCLELRDLPSGHHMTNGEHIHRPMDDIPQVERGEHGFKISTFQPSNIAGSQSFS